MKPFVPTLEKLPKRTALRVVSVGDPNVVMAPLMPRLYGTAYGTKMKVFKPKGKIMTVGPLSAYWPDAHHKPKSKWTGIWNLQVSDFVKAQDLLQKDPKNKVSLVTLPAGLYARVLYIGTYANETKTIQSLHAFIKANKRKMIGDHEEVYLSKPGPKSKTVIQYLVK